MVQPLLREPSLGGTCGRFTVINAGDRKSFARREPEIGPSSTTNLKDSHFVTWSVAWCIKVYEGDNRIPWIFFPMSASVFLFPERM
jgi:hypothetical protein